ncbi:MAG: TetR/AcrR family transcriptional regulator [Coriobacteriales bacterium]|nr:TetR/AcrR family transcriptional regulator [Coriobacteriales bacterium]
MAKPGSPASLTPQQIAEAALALGDRIGIENVSVRKLAAELGKTPMALYTYFPSVKHIHEAVLELAFKEVDADPIPGERWDDTMRRTMRSIRAMYHNHLNCHLIKAEGFGYSPGMQEHTARIYRLHEEQGIPPEILRRAWQVIDAFLGGFISAETDELTENPSKPEANGRVWMETAKHAYSDQAFDEGMEIILAGIRSIAAPDPCEWRTPIKA